jgi:hypothetical protein
MAAQFSLEDHLEVRNRGVDDIILSWNNRHHTVPAGGKNLVPATAIINFLGDPRAGSNVTSYKISDDEVMFIPDRKTEIRRLNAKWGNDPNNEEDITPTKPNVEVYDGQGQRVYTVIDDPTGELAIPSNIVTQNSQQDMIVKLQKQVEALSAQVGQQAANGPVRGRMTEDQLPVDPGDNDSGEDNDYYMANDDDTVPAPRMFGE